MTVHDTGRRPGASLGREAAGNRCLFVVDVLTGACARRKMPRFRATGRMCQVDSATGDGRMGNWKKASGWWIVVGAVAIGLIALALRKHIQGLANGWLQGWN